jgi:hypothetical protein
MMKVLMATDQGQSKDGILLKNTKIMTMAGALWGVPKEIAPGLGQPQMQVSSDRNGAQGEATACHQTQNVGT